MIDFRYHVVSIVAVFLALSIGIVLGSTELKGKTLDVLSQTSDQLHRQLNTVSGQRDNYASQLSADNEFAQTNEALLVRGLLAGKRVVMITEPGAPDNVITGVTKAVQLAGGSVTGQVALQPKFNDTSGATESTLNGINGTIAQADGTSLTSGSNQETVNQQQAAQLLATAVLAAPSSATGPTQEQVKTLLTTYAQAGFLSVTDQLEQQQAATVAIVIPPANPPSDGGSDQANQVLVAVAQELAGASSATLVAGSAAGSGAGSALATLRSSSVSGQVSTVDNADTAFGQTTVIQTLARQLSGGKPGSYGVEAGASSAGPSPAPTPSASVSASPAPTTSKKAKGS